MERVKITSPAVSFSAKTEKLNGKTRLTMCRHRDKLFMSVIGCSDEDIERILGLSGKQWTLVKEVKIYEVRE